MSELEREEIKRRTEGMTAEEIKETISHIPDPFIFEEIIARYSAMKEKLQKVAEVTQ